jgi:hypothetical protein
MQRLVITPHITPAFSNIWMFRYANLDTSECRCEPLNADAHTSRLRSWFWESWKSLEPLNIFEYLNHSGHAACGERVRVLACCIRIFDVLFVSKVLKPVSDLLNVLKCVEYIWIFENRPRRMRGVRTCSGFGAQRRIGHVRATGTFWMFQ